MHLNDTRSDRHTVALLLAAALVAAPPAMAQSTATPAATPVGDRLACAGPLGRDTSHAKVAAAYGKDNVVFRQVDGAEGEKIGATVVFPKTAAKRMELFWADDKKRSGLASLRLGPGSIWIAPNGLRIGAPLAEVEKLNGRPFELSGFDWDYGGMVTDWKGGALAGPATGGCTVSVGFIVPPGAPETAAAKVAGDNLFPSTDKNMRAVKPIVGSLGFGYPQP